jgi:hypothetical protein
VSGHINHYSCSVSVTASPGPYHASVKHFEKVADRGQQAVSPVNRRSAVRRAACPRSITRRTAVPTERTLPGAYPRGVPGQRGFRRGSRREGKARLHGRGVDVLLTQHADLPRRNSRMGIPANPPGAGTPDRPPSWAPVASGYAYRNDRSIHERHLFSRISSRISPSPDAFPSRIGTASPNINRAPR